MPRRPLQIALGLALVGVGGYLALSPRVVAEALGLSHATAGEWINLRASWGGTLAGLGAFLAWLPALRPWRRSLAGLLTWTMAGVALARLTGFALDGRPDGRQLLWITAELIIVALGARELAAPRPRRA